MPKVSVIVPVYNVEKYVTKALTSLAEQTLDDIEIVIVNDGATDGSKEEIDKFLEQKDKYPGKEFVYVEQENAGLSEARNTGLKNATGEYVAFLDADDYVDATAYERMYKKAIKENADYVECDFYWEYHKANGKIKLKKDSAYQTKNKKEMFVYSRVVAWNKLIRKSKIEIQFPKGLRYEDLEFFYKLLQNIENISYVDEPLIYYVQRENSLANKSDEAVGQIFEVLNNVIEWYKRNNIYDEYKTEIEYTYARILLCSSLKRILKVENKELREQLVNETWTNLNAKFPNWRKNKYLNKLSVKNLFMKSMNRVRYNIYCGIRGKE